MPTAEQEERQLLETRLNKSLDDAESKTATALESMRGRKPDLEKNLWAAAEAAEYASLVYSLRHRLEDASVPAGPRAKSNEESFRSIDDSRQSFQRIRDLSRKTETNLVLEGYKMLRHNADALRNIYLKLAKSPAR